jgi:hypothetical protein
LKRALEAKDLKGNENDMYIYKTVIEMIWPYDVRGRLLDEDVWEPTPKRAELITLNPAKVLTTKRQESNWHHSSNLFPLLMRWRWAGRGSLIEGESVHWPKNNHHRFWDGSSLFVGCRRWPSDCVQNWHHICAVGRLTALK